MKIQRRRKIASLPRQANACRAPRRAGKHVYRALIAQSAEGVALTDGAGLLIDWNDANERITGLSRAQVIGLPCWDVALQLLPPAERTPEQAESVKTALLDALRSARPYRPAWPEMNVRAYLRDKAGTHFDPAVVSAFLELLATG